MSEATPIAFTPDASAEIHEEGALALICAPFRSHEAGLPEWLKNSSDMYVRANAEKDDSVILLLFRHGNQQRFSAIGCLDFGGMSTGDIEGKFKKWGDPEASLADDGSSTEGGHGNGGKCYMTQLFTSHSYVHTLRSGRGNKYGFVGERYVGGYFPTITEGRGFEVVNPNAELEKALADFGLTYSDLPQVARDAFERSNGFTLVAGFGAKYHEEKRLPIKDWVKNLQGHQQALNAILNNRIFVFAGGKPLTPTSELILPEIVPLPDAPLPREIPIPAEMPDPKQSDNMVLVNASGSGRLILKTSEKQMTHSLRPRHTIQGRTSSGKTTGYWEVRTLSRAAYAFNIYGDVILDELDEFKQNDRRQHSEGPITRALDQWLGQQIDAYSAEFVKIDRLQASEEEKDELKRLNEMLDEWKNDYLRNEFGAGGMGGDEDDGRKIRKRRQLPKGTPARAELSLTHEVAGQGVSLKPKLEFFDQQGNRIRPVPFEWGSSDWAVATIDAELNVLNTHSPGRTELSIHCPGTGISSNAVEFEVLDIDTIDLVPKHLKLGLGKRATIQAVVRTRDGRRIDGAYLIWTEGNETVVSVGSGGSVFGMSLGTTSVTAGDDQAVATEEVQVEVVEAEDGEDGGGGFPRILLSEIQQDPDSGEIPEFSSAEPPVHQRPIDVDRNIWWINMASPLARRHLDEAKGGGSASPEWRAYMLERYIEALVKIVLTYDFEHGEDVSFETMLRRWDEESSSWQHRISESLANFLDGVTAEAVAA